MVDGVFTEFAYDAAGRLDWRADTVDGIPFAVDYDYDAGDNLRTITYPAGRQVRYDYDTQNRIARVWNPVTDTTYANEFGYHPSGALTSYTAGNSVVTTLSYHPTRQWLETLVAGQGDDRTQLTYAYDDVGNITSILDWRGGMSQTFGYDALDRLTAASGFYGPIDYTYDAHGNRQTAGAVGYTYQSGNPFRLQSVNGAFSLAYDGNGSLRSGFGGQYDYTPDNLLAVSTVSGTTTRFTYDADAWRLKKAVDGGVTTYFVRGPNGQLLSESTTTGPPTVRDYVYAGARLIGVITRHDTAGTVATPTISPGGGTFTPAVTVTLATATFGATIRYTTDGSSPTSSSTVYAGPFAVGQTGTVKARGFKDGMQDSAVASAAFTIGGGGGTSAVFLQVDATTQGTWQGVYGQDGKVVIADATSYPAYAQVTSSGYGTYGWSGATSETRALQRATNPSTRLAATWYTAETMRLDVNLTDGAAHEVAIYNLDWDDQAREQRFDIRDASTGALLDTRTVSGFTNGKYLVWRLTGHVWIDVTNLSSANATISGVFFDPVASAAFVGVDTATQGTWQGVYGQDGHVVIADSTSYPAYVQVTASGYDTYGWSGATSEPRALQRATNPSTRLAATWYSATTMRLDVNLTDGAAHEVAVYNLDWDDLSREQRFDIRDASTGALLDTRTVSGFTNGRYLVWRLTGHVWIDVTNLVSGANAVISGVFFDPPSP